MTDNNVKIVYTNDKQDQELLMIISGQGKRKAKRLKKLIDTNLHSFDTLTDIERFARKVKIVPENNLACFLN